MFFSRKKTERINQTDALPGRDNPIPTAEAHFLNGNRLKPPYPAGLQSCYFGMGCFWGAERKFWELSDIWVTAVGYAAGDTTNPTYEEVCTGRTNHNEVVLVVYDPAKTPFQILLKTFWESHDPTQGMRQGNDRGTQYRSGIYATTPEQLEMAGLSRNDFQAALSNKGLGVITTEIMLAPEFYYAEDYHQQYLAKNPQGYCGIGGTGVRCPSPMDQEGT